VVLPRTAVATTESRRISTTRSILAGTAIVVGAGLIGAAIRSGGDINKGPSRVPGGGQQ
jgi:hypothetical protein